MPGRPGPRPNAWVSGPDPERHKRYLQWLQQKNQAQYRCEGWTMTFEEWLDLWGDNIQFRGRQKGTMTMVRIDYNKPWSKDNARVVDRKEHARVQQAVVAAKRRKNGKNN